MRFTHDEVCAYLGIHPNSTGVFKRAGVPARGKLSEAQAEKVIQAFRRDEGIKVLWAARHDAEAMLERLRAGRVKRG